MKKRTPKPLTPTQLENLRREIYRHHKCYQAEEEKATTHRIKARTHQEKADQHRREWRKLLQIETRETAE